MDKREYVLTRGVEKVLPTKEGLAKIMAERKITLYQGFDPSNPSLHVGNFIGIRKLSQFQKLGHRVIFLVGDFTGMIGDPTDKSAARRKLTREEILNNLKDYKDQAGKILEFTGPNAAKIMFNYDWLSKLTFEDVVELASHFTVQQMIERDFFQNRLKEGKPIYLHEFLYPLMQGYDSVAMDVDLEIGGSDQLFNILAGRTLMKEIKNKEKYALSLKLLTDPSGKKMGKTTGNAIFLTDSPTDIFAKVMAFPDAMLPLATELLTDIPIEEIRNPNQLGLKKKVGLDIVGQIYGEKKAKEAQKSFEDTFQKKAPKYSKEIDSLGKIIDTLAQIDSVGSKTQAKRLLLQGAIDVNGKKTTDSNYTLKSGDQVKVGERVFVKIT
ncbi:tyrosine--tRNA ligase [Candidatus Woesebacteria bacterium]|nr:tyrosine--tRNA ligase [Candidatus Woesebacteria bacterium]